MGGWQSWAYRSGAAGAALAGGLARIALGVGGFVGYLITITMGSILLSWIYRTTRESVLMVALWHGLFDFVSASPIAEGTSNAVINTAVIVWVIVILRTAGRRLQQTRHKISS